MILEHSVSNPKNSKIELQKKLCDPSHLPTHAELSKAFTTREEWEHYREDMGFYRQEFFEVLNEEFINALSNYLTERINFYDGTAETPITVLDVGAGDGRLNYFLRKKLEQRPDKSKFRIIATDSGKWEIKPVFPIENQPRTKALQKYQPTIVLCSWMPSDEDWTVNFRKTPSVKEYILVGEAESGLCGDKWKTWGVVNHDTWIERPDNAPYKIDGFEQVRLDDITAEQISIMSNYGENKKDKGTSSTISFRRKEIK